MSLREEIEDRLDKLVQSAVEGNGLDYYVNASEDILKLIEIRIDEKIQHVNEVMNDSRLTIQGCQRLKGRKDAFEEMKEMLK